MSFVTSLCGHEKGALPDPGSGQRASLTNDPGRDRSPVRGIHRDPSADVAGTGRETQRRQDGGRSSRIVAVQGEHVGQRETGQNGLHHLRRGAQRTEQPEPVLRTFDPDWLASVARTSGWSTRVDGCRSEAEGHCGGRRGGEDLAFHGELPLWIGDVAFPADHGPERWFFGAAPGLG